MSNSVENILYVGQNIELAQTMLKFSSSDGGCSNYELDHVRHIDIVESVLSEKKYDHFICEDALSEERIAQISIRFPLLKTTYLSPPLMSNSSVIPGSISDDVKSAIDYLSIPIYFKNNEGTFLACNRYFSNLIGKTPDEVVGKTVADILPLHLAKEIEKLDKKIFSNNQIYLYESTIHDLDGEAHDVVFCKERVADTNTQIGFIFDVTEINTTKATLEKERIMLRATADISKDLIFFKDLEGRFLGCNKQFEKFVGCSEKEIIGKTDDQLFEFYQALMCQEQDRLVMDTKQIYVGEEYLTYNNGERHFIDMKKEALQDRTGKVQGLIGVGRDMSAHHILQKRLKIADTVFENSKENFLVTDEKGIIISVNKSLCSTSGYSKSELINQDITIFQSNQHRNIAINLKENKAWQGDLSYIRKNGEVGYAWLETYAVEHEEEGNLNFVFSFINFTQDGVVDKKIEHLATFDPLTGLFNRIALQARLKDAMTRAEFKEIAMAVILIDINGFKDINAQYGHSVGDAVLKETAERLKCCVFEKDTVARFGNHEFVIIVDELVSEQDAAVVARKIADQFNQRFKINELDIDVSASMGIAMCPDDGADIDTIINSAEEAKLRAKSDRSGCYHFYTSELTAHSQKQFELEKELSQALELEQFELYFQPQFNIRKKQIVAVEALVRWNHPQRGLLEPDNFLSLAENTGLLLPITMYVIRKAAMQAASWHRAGIHFDRISINLSQMEVESPKLIGELQRILLECQCQSKWLEFAIDETVFICSSPTIYENLINIGKLGIAMMIDNYAADRPALYLINKLGIEKFKLSNHYFQGLSSTHHTSTAIMNALSILGNSLGVDIVSESIGEFNQDGHPLSEECSDQKGPKVMKASEATFYLRCNKRK
ncbi:EAL domain-containing protein [Psychromonas sp. PT13]|uniref:EAL domain-containing protein n=1 Tax=Psychromonas sp. PT13 TaxID=3439547 RepID=UPI003EBEAB28